MSIEDVVKKLQDASKKPSNTKELAEAYLDYLEAKYRCKDTPLYQFGLTPNDALCKALADIQKNGIWEKTIYKKAVWYLAEAWRKKTKHKDRREKIENSIRLLKRLHEERGEGLNPETLALLAKAYLRRSKIIRPKGITTPEKKKEAIKEGIYYAEEVTNNKSISHDKKENAYRCRAMLYIEKERILEESERNDDAIKNKIQTALKDAMENGCKKFSVFKNYIKIAVLYSELSGDTQYLDDVVKSTVSGIELEKARAYKIKGQIYELEKEMNSLIKRLHKTSFSAPIWDDTVKFLRKLQESNITCWEKLSIRMWRVCTAIERKTQSLHLRWYWSRMRDLYDLAFLAAKDNYKLKAEIADSLKSRPALKLNVIEEYVKSLPDGEEKNLLKEKIEEHATAYLDGYIKGIKKEPSLSTKKNLPIDSVPGGWIVIHFYLNHLEGKGYALRIDNSKWTQEPFEYNELFKSYIEWQTNYTRYKEGAAGTLVELCKTIGDKMDFLFNLPKEKSVLFIPHDFLHRLPLHGAIKDGKVFLEDYKTCYLPAWSFARETVPSNNGNKYLLINSHDFPDVAFNKDNFKTIEDFDGLSNNPSLLAVVCHGRADTVNPFNSKLLLEDNDRNHLYIMQHKSKLTRTKVILGACETDLVPFLSVTIDEHLSISTAFLNKGVSEILGTMWEVLIGDDADELTELINNNIPESIKCLLWDWQKRMVNNFINEPIKFYRAVLFRVFGAL